MLVVGWAVAIALILIKTHQIFYYENEELLIRQIPYLHYKGPAFTDIDRLFLVAVSILMALFLAEAKSVIYGYFTAMVLSSLIAVVYLFFYIWFALGFAELLSPISFGWELGVFLAIINVFRFMVPIGIIFSLLGVALGSVIRVWLKPT